MSKFWSDIASTVFRHAGERYLSGYDEELKLLYDQIRELRMDMTSAQGDVEVLENLYTELDQATNDIASKLEALAEHANSGGVSASDVASHLTPLIQRLQAMGKDSTVDSPTDPTTTTDPTNSPVATDPSVNPAPDAPTDNPTPDPTVNPVDLNPASDAPAQTDTASTTESANPNNTTSDF